MTLINMWRHFSPNMGYFTHSQENSPKKCTKLRKKKMN